MSSISPQNFSQIGQLVQASWETVTVDASGMKGFIDFLCNISIKDGSIYLEFEVDMCSSSLLKSILRQNCIYVGRT